jgi:AraC family transcriptional regulator
VTIYGYALPHFLDTASSEVSLVRGENIVEIARKTVLTATEFEPCSYTMLHSVVPPEFAQGEAQEPENYAGLDGTRPHFHQRANHAADGVVEVSPPDAVSRRTARWPGMAVEIVQASRRCRIDYRYYAPAPLLVFHERGVRHDGCTVIEGLPRSTLQDCQRKLVLVPAGHRYHDWHEPRTLSRTIFFYFNPSQLAVGPDLGLWHLSLTPKLFFENAALTETALKLATLIESGGSDQQRHLEALGVVLAHELVRINAGRHSTHASVNGGLAGWQGRKAVAYIEAHLAESISLEVLAGLVGLSAGYFCAAFRRSFGMPPHRYQRSQRIERAKRLLSKRAASVTDVGLTVGYGDSSAFCTAFRRITGLTPTAYRRGLS